MLIPDLLDEKSVPLANKTPAASNENVNMLNTLLIIPDCFITVSLLNIHIEYNTCKEENVKFCNNIIYL